MKKILITTLLLSSIIVLPAGAGDGCNCQSQRGTLSVSYSTEKEVSPDTAEFSIAIKTSDKKSMQDASDKNKEISTKVYNYLKSNINNANGDYIKTSNYSAAPVYIYNNGKRNFDKYEVSNNIIVHTKSLDNVSSLIDKSIQLGATDVNSLNFTLSNKDAKCLDLLSQSAKQVRSRANTVAESAGTVVTGVKELRTSCSLNQRATRYGYTNMKLMRAVGASADSTMEEAAPANIEAGNITIYANVDATYYVK
ncbi:SIMPL domain-containing protein [bacterium]|nr:SIMPL domain-containing protein [bacterium]